MQGVEKSESCQGTNDGDDVKDDPLLTRHDCQEWVWEFAIDSGSMFNP